MLQEFATTPDIDGNMLIDNTIIVYVTELARAWDRNQQNMPVLVFGGKNTRVNGGTFLKIKDGPLPAQTGGTGNRPFNDLWLALAAVFGVPLTSLGDKTQYTGPLAGVFRAGVTPAIRESAGAAGRAASGAPRARRETAAGSG